MRYRVDGWEGIAFDVVGCQMVDDEDTDWTGEQVPTGMLLVVMVGDDKQHAVEPYEVHPITDESYCHECGQLGCTADGRDA